MTEELGHPIPCLEHLTEYLGREGVAYTVTEHPARYTAQELAQVEHISGRLIAKIGPDPDPNTTAARWDPQGSPRYAGTNR